jgi:formamidase
VVRFRLHKGEAKAKRIVWPRFAHPGFFARPEYGMPRNFIATMGMPIGRAQRELRPVARREDAVLEMIKLLEERGWTREQAYVICSVAVDLRVSQVVDVPNVTVSALLPEGIFKA